MKEVLIGGGAFMILTAIIYGIYIVRDTPFYYINNGDKLRAVNSSVGLSYFRPGCWQIQKKRFGSFGKWINTRYDKSSSMYLYYQLINFNTHTEAIEFMQKYLPSEYL